MMDFKEAFRIDFARRPTMLERLDAKKVELAVLKQQQQQREQQPQQDPEGGTICTTVPPAAAVAAAVYGKTAASSWTTKDGDTTIETTLPPIPRPISNANVHAMSTSTSKDQDDEDEDEDILTALKIELVLKLCTAQMSCGQCTVDTERHASTAAIALGLHPPTLDIGPRVMHAAFYPQDNEWHYDPTDITTNPNHPTVPKFLTTNRDIILCKLQDITWIAKLVALYGETRYQHSSSDLIALLAIVDDILMEPLPYGWFIQDLLFVSLCTLATIGAFFGSYSDMFIVFVIALCLVGLQKITKCFPTLFGPLEMILVCAISSLITAAAFRIAAMTNYDRDQICNVPIIYLSPLLVYLPGSELIYGAYEVQMGHMVVGASRLVHALVKCMVMASGLTIGWQFTGYNFKTWYDEQDQYSSDANSTIPSGASSSYVPKEICEPFADDWNVGPWYVVFCGWNLVFLIPVLGGLQVRPRDIPSHYSIAYVSLIIFAVLNFQDGWKGLPNFMVNIIGLFATTNFACLKEYITGAPAVTSIIPVLLVLAPGSVVVLELLSLMQISNGVDTISGNSIDIASYMWLLGVTYSLGMYIALAIWKPILVGREVKSTKLLDLVKKEARYRASVNMVGKH